MCSWQFSAATSRRLGLLGVMRMARHRHRTRRFFIWRRPSGPRGIMRSTAFSSTRSGKRPSSDLARGALLDAAGMAGVPVVHLVGVLLAGERDLLGIDDDDVVAVIDMRGEGGLVLAAQAVGDDGREAADDEAFGIDQDPLLRPPPQASERRLPYHSLSLGPERRTAGRFLLLGFDTCLRGSKKKAAREGPRSAAYSSYPSRVNKRQQR